MDDTAPAREESETETSHREPSLASVLAAVTLAGLLPWSVQSFVGGEIFLRFAWGGVSFEPAFTVQLLAEYPLFAGPPILFQWALSTGVWLLALASAASARIGLEDPRVTVGLLAVAGLLNLSVALDFGIQPSRTGYPTGTLFLWAVAVWRYRRVDGWFR
ncbi:MAG: TIGR04206 family protein [Halobaculum sp.]